MSNLHDSQPGGGSVTATNNGSIYRALSQAQCDPKPLAFPVHSQTSLDLSSLDSSLQSHSCLLLPYLCQALQKRSSHRMEFLLHNDHAALGSTSLFCDTRSNPLAEEMGGNPEISRYSRGREKHPATAGTCGEKRIINDKVRRQAADGISPSCCKRSGVWAGVRSPRGIHLT